MANYSLCLAALAFCLLLRASSQGTPSVLTITPNPLIPGESVTVVCKAPSDAGGLLYSMRINRKVGSTVTPLVTTDPIKQEDYRYNTGPARLLPTLEGYSVSGGMRQRSITLVMAEAKCTDAAEYVCRVTSSEHNDSVVNLKYLTPKVEPTDITQTTVNTYPVLVMVCESLVAVTNETKIEWQWEYRQKRRFGGLTSLGWKPYSESSSYNPADIKTEIMLPGSSDPNSCCERQRSTMYRHLRQEDNRREYRCYFTVDGRSYTKFAKTYYVGVFVAAGEQMKTED